MIVSLKKKLNVILSNGLHVVSAKVNQGAALATLFVTDYTNNSRLIFDMESKKILANIDGVDVSAKDMESIFTILSEKEKEKVKRKRNKKKEKPKVEEEV
jgi:hypothetical protein